MNRHDTTLQSDSLNSPLTSDAQSTTPNDIQTDDTPYSFILLLLSLSLFSCVLFVVLYWSVCVGSVGFLLFCSSRVELSSQ